MRYKEILLAIVTTERLELDTSNYSANTADVDSAETVDIVSIDGIVRSFNDDERAVFERWRATSDPHSREMIVSELEAFCS